MKSKLKQFKRELVLGASVGLLVLGMVKGLGYHAAKLEEAEVRGCSKLSQLTINRLLLPSCVMMDGKLVVKVGLLNQYFDVETGDAIVSE